MLWEMDGRNPPAKAYFPIGNQELMATIAAAPPSQELRFPLRSDGVLEFWGVSCLQLAWQANLELSLFVPTSCRAIVIKVSGGTKERHLMFLSPKHCFPCSVHVKHLTQYSHNRELLEEDPGICKWVIEVRIPLYYPQNLATSRIVGYIGKEAARGHLYAGYSDLIWDSAL